MKFLLVAVNAKYIHSNPAIYSLRAGAGEESGPFVELAEYTINQRMQDILADLYRRKPDAIGFSCYIWNREMIGELLRELPKILPRAELWAGGPEATYDAPGMLRQFPRLKGVMVGEGEMTFRELMRWYREREAAERGKAAGEEDGSGFSEAGLEEIAGLCLPSRKAAQEGGETFLYTPEREPADLNSLPFPYEDTDAFANRIVYYESSRGCPFCCSYCLSSIDKKVRLRDMELVRRELRFFLEHRVRQVKFVDRTFNCDHEHAMAIWRYLCEYDNSVTNFHFEISADLLREEEIALLNQMRPGLVQLEIGVQSVNPRALQAVSRKADLEKLERNVAAVRRGRNIHQHLDLIAGLPYEDYESFKHSFNRVYAMRPEQLQLGFLKVLKGSKMQEKAEEYGICYLDQPPYEVLYTKWLSYEEVLRLKQVEEMTELYYNSNQFTRTLPFLEQAFESPFALFEELAGFYEERGYFLQSPARTYRYQVLFEFAGSRDPEYEDVYRELLVFDLYLRENLKSRPDFCADDAKAAGQRTTRMSESRKKELSRAFYQAEERKRQYLPAYSAYDWKQMSKMTHLEFFDYPVWDAEGSLRRGSGEQGEACGILFDYLSRDPLNYEAAYRVIPLRELAQMCGAQGEDK